MQRWETIEQQIRLYMYQGKRSKFKFSLFWISGDQGKIWITNPPGVLHLRVLHQPDRDDVLDNCWHSGFEQPGS